MKTRILLFLLIGFSFQVKGQNYLLDSAKNGVHIAGEFAWSNGSNINGATLGYTADGVFTFGIAGGVENSKDFEEKAYSLKPYFSFMALKQGINNSPLSVGFGCSYQYTWLPDLEDVKGNSLALDAGIFRKIRIGNGCFFVPGISGGWMRTRIEQKGYYRTSMEDSSFFLGLQSSLLLGPLVITPAYQFAKMGRAFSLTTGFVFPGK